VTGFVTRGGAVAVHRTGCQAGRRMRESGRGPVEVAWMAGAPSPVGFRATVHAEALNRPRLLADLTAVISGEGIGIVSAEVGPPQQLRVRHTYTVELPTAETLPTVLRAMLKVSGVYDVYRPGDRNGDDSGMAGMRPSWGIQGRKAAFTGARPAGEGGSPQG
jgi:GTP pyrophosphokinase